jgi:hypothetical protein
MMKRALFNHVIVLRENFDKIPIDMAISCGAKVLFANKVISVRRKGAQLTS